jgi:hypothetical protein
MGKGRRRPGQAAPPSGAIGRPLGLARLRDSDSRPNAALGPPLRLGWARVRQPIRAAARSAALLASVALPPRPPAALRFFRIATPRNLQPRRLNYASAVILWCADFYCAPPPSGCRSTDAMDGPGPGAHERPWTPRPRPHSLIVLSACTGAGSVKVRNRPMKVHLEGVERWRFWRKVSLKSG